VHCSAACLAVESAELLSGACPEAATPHMIQHSLCDKMRENIQLEKRVCVPGSGLSH